MGSTLRVQPIGALPVCDGPWRQRGQPGILTTCCQWQDRNPLYNNFWGVSGKMGGRLADGLGIVEHHLSGWRDISVAAVSVCPAGSSGQAFLRVSEKLSGFFLSATYYGLFFICIAAKKVYDLIIKVELSCHSYFPGGPTVVTLHVLMPLKYCWLLNQ